ncbi:MAG: cupin domain-containing protein, partial [Lentisphaeria bacterium]|nr:cupin domain-containing protein [Lentisphaeria bacterium]
MDKTKELLSSGIRKMICASMEGTSWTGRSIQNSMHEEIEFLFVIDGNSRFMLNHKSFALEPGDMVVIDSWDSHA